jgi:hypothetical protein
MPILVVQPQWKLGNEPEVENISIPSSSAGNMKTVDLMVRVARERAGHPIVRSLALNILNSARIDSHQYLDEAEAIGRFVQRHVTYVRDAVGFEQVHDPILMIEKISSGEARGDCDDMALLIATLLLSIGHYPFFRIVKYRSSFGSYNHIYVVDYERNGYEKRERLVLDAIIKDRPIGFEVKHAYGREIPI